MTITKDTQKLPIGVFDSGVGGLTVLKELAHVLPYEDFIYLGDVARVPYGTKSPSVIQRYSRRCVEFLVDKGVKTIVVACNTATAAALETLRSEFPLEIFGVIKPGVRAAIAASRSKRVLVWATPATVRSEAYPLEFRRQDPSVIVEQVPCPLLVPLAEEGWFDKPVTRSVLSHYLEASREKEFDVLLLGCTHYPLLTHALEPLLSPETRWVHSGASLAHEISSELARKDLLKSSTALGKVTFYSTDQISAGPILKTLFGEEARFEVADLS